MSLSGMEIFGAWLSIFLTLGVFSFLYEDNPIYKLTEHIFLGVSIGYAVVESYYGVFKPNLLDKLGGAEFVLLSLVYLLFFAVMVGLFLAKSSDKDDARGPLQTLAILLLGIVIFYRNMPSMTTSFDPVFLLAFGLLVLLFFKLNPKHSWLARFPIAFMVSAYAAVKMTGDASAKLIKQIETSIPDLSKSWNVNGFWNWESGGAGIFSDLFLVLGLCACLIHFYFSDSKPGKDKPALAGGAIAFVVVAAAVLVQVDISSIPAKVFVGLMLGACAAMPFMAFTQYKVWVSRFGIIVLMLSFGASFGYTVMGRLSLAIGRGQELLGYSVSEEAAAQIQPRVVTLICAVAIIGYLVVWRRRRIEAGANA